METNAGVPDSELDASYKVALELAHSAGQVIKEAFQRKDKGLSTKSTSADLVTVTDRKVEDMAFTLLREKFPHHSFIGEETAAAGVRSELTDNPTWMIDPIDGTTNFVHGFPFVCISIALCVKKQVEIGIIHNPILNETYTARRGQGAYLNGERIQTGSQDDLSKSLVLTEFGAHREEAFLSFKFKNMRSVINKAHGIRCTGSAALALCQLAKGGADAYFEFGIHCWDIAAGDLIAREAGAFTMDTQGGPVDLMSRRIIGAATEKLARELSSTIDHTELERD
ncbi:inositol monophosphatase 1 [Lingula anatina]|uniref:Inositol-1-monophosphatase n=1 Tax=Lingula anatina TaxID=7574 RepID=A0A1S3H7C0_LINAN|nr:inositol monophosphatase 1 [Lingula anatina]|eukprot:XP_013381381.1 inositol monophosphatase 1 [Lingula anatina]